MCIISSGTMNLPLLKAPDVLWRAIGTSDYLGLGMPTILRAFSDPQLPVYAFAAGAPNESSFALVFRLGVIPQFLFSGAFFPISNLSPVLEAIARLTPLYQGVDLARMLTLGTLDAGPALVHLVYLLVMVVVGHVLAVRRLTRRLVV